MGGRSLPPSEPGSFSGFRQGSRRSHAKGGGLVDCLRRTRARVPQPFPSAHTLPLLPIHHRAAYLKWWTHIWGLTKKKKKAPTFIQEKPRARERGRNERRIRTK